jgi:SEC-C motif-containing protein
MDKQCPCGSNKVFGKCCGRFLGGEQWARTPEQLMRSRYSAYSLGNHGDYLLKTWFPATARGLSAATLSRREHEWTALEILDKSQDGDQGMVEFKAWYREGDGEPQLLHEKSVFQRMGGRWLYVGGEVDIGPA